MNTRLLSFASLATLLALAGCKEELISEAEAPARPVMSVVVGHTSSAVTAFAGTIAPRHQTNLGFRVLGRMDVREVSVGDVIKKGDRLAALDPLALQLALRSAEADRQNAKAELANATAAEARHRTLLGKKHVSPAQFEQTQLALETAEAGLVQAESAYTKAKEQLGYSELRAEFSGVVTAVHVEVGQTVSPGEPIVTVAGVDALEAVVDVSDSLAEDMTEGDRFEVISQLDTSITASGSVREIGPQADAATRTRRLRIALDNPPPGFRIGTTVTANLAAPIAGHIELPVTAVLEQDGKTIVWIIDPTTGTVSSREVKIARRNGDRIEITAGLTPGARVAVAGVNSLTDGQTVKIPRT